MVSLLMFLSSCSQDDTFKDQTETSTQVHDVFPQKMPFDQAPHFERVRLIVKEMGDGFSAQTVQNRGDGETETFEILTDEVIYMEYEESHTYTFKVRRSRPEFYIENVVLHYDPETDGYDEFFIQYLVNEEDYLAIVNNSFSGDELPVLAGKFERGTFTVAMRSLNCVVSCETIKVNCTAGGNHAPGQACTGSPAQQPYTTISCSTVCYMDTSFEDQNNESGHGGASAGNTNTVPFPMEPCDAGGGGTGPGTGIDNGEGMCLVPWVASLNLSQAELQVFQDYPDLLDLFGQYFAAMGTDADNGLIRSLINYMVVNNDYQNIDYVYDVIYAALDGTLISAIPFFKYPAGSNYATQYPKLTQYLKNELPTVNNNSHIINSIKKYTNLSSAQIKQHLQWGEGPVIRIEQLGQAYGVFKKNVDPNSLYLDIDLINQMENTTPGTTVADAFIFVIGVTILHEYVHYGDYNYNGDTWQYPQEEGLLFEEDVYGQSVWIENAEIILKNSQP